MTPEPDVLDFVDLPGDVKDEFVDFVLVNGAEYPLQEFTQAERHLWLKVRDESDLMKIVKEFGELRRQLDEFTGGALVEKKEARLRKLDAEVDRFIESVPFDEWSESHDKKLNAMVAALETAKRELYGIQSPLEDKALENSSVMQSRIEELRDRQQMVHLRFMWLLAKKRHQELRSWEQYQEDAKGSDRQNAAEVVQAGNFTWETQAPTRPANRAMRRNNRMN